MNTRPLLIFGFGGHARSVADVALGVGRRDLTFIDNNARHGEKFQGFPVIPDAPRFPPLGAEVFSASGDNRVRQAVVQSATLPLATLVARSANVSLGVTIGVGTFVGHMVHVGPNALIGAGVILNSSAVVEHESEIGDFSHVSVNATVAGRSRIGRRTMLGAASVIIDGVSVCDDVIIGAGAVVTSDISIPGTYVGVPARRIER